MPVTWRPLVTAQEMQAAPTAADRQARHQNLIGKLRGDAGYLGGFAFGTPLAPSRQQVTLPPDDGFGYGYGYGEDGGSGGRGRRQVVINNNGPVAIAIGNDNLIQQQTANGPGPIAQQQVATIGGKTSKGGGNVNMVSGDGVIIQQVPR
jgi:hypothetical protein